MSSLPSESDLSVIGDVLFGDLARDQHPWLELSTTSSPVPFRPQFTLELRLNVRGDRFPKGITVPEGLQWQSFVVKEIISILDVPSGDTERFQFAVRLIEMMGKKMPKTIYEVDPRIGLVMTEDFPSAPLFDPPYVNQPYKTCFQRMYSSRHPMNLALDQCPFCGEANRLSYFGPPTENDSVWCGGNVGFAHVRCAPWVTPRMP